MSYRKTDYKPIIYIILDQAYTNLDTAESTLQAENVVYKPHLL